MPGPVLSARGAAAFPAPNDPSSATLVRPDHQIADNLTAQRGAVFLTGVQALVRLPLMQAALDRARGIGTAGFISGYRGSPLGGYDLALWKAGALLDAAQVAFQPAIYEALAGTAVLASQQVESDPERTVAGRASRLRRHPGGRRAIVKRPFLRASPAPDTLPVATLCDLDGVLDTFQAALGRARLLPGRCAERLHIAGDLATRLDQDLPVTDLAAHPPGGVNDELTAGGQLAVESPEDLRHVDAHLAGERAVLGDANDPTVHGRFHPSFHDQRVAIENFGALELDIGSDDEPAAAPLRRILGGHRRVRLGGRRGHGEAARNSARHAVARTAGCSARSAGKPGDRARSHAPRADARSAGGLGFRAFGECGGFVEHDLSLKVARATACASETQESNVHAKAPKRPEFTRLEIASRNFMKIFRPFRRRTTTSIARFIS
jgi:hypothetical protein